MVFFFLRASRDHFLEKLAPDDDCDSCFVESIWSRPKNKRSIKIGKALPMESEVSAWLISDLIPKKSEKFEFRKNFGTIFFKCQKLTQKTKFWYFSHSQILKLILQFFENCVGKKYQNFVFWISFWHWKIWYQNFSEIRTFRIF